MEGWKEIALNEIGWFKGAGVNKLINTDEQPVYLVNYMDVYKHWRIYYNTNYQEVTAKDREIEEANLLEGDVLFTPSSEKPIDIGHAGVVMETMPNCVYSYHLIRLRLYDKTQFDLKYLSYLLNSDDVQKHFVSRASGSGIRYTLSLSDFKSAKIRFPKKSEQSAIAAMLSKVDETIASVQASIAAAELLKKSLMQNLLTGRMKPDGTLRKEDEFYLDEKFGRVPVGWEVKKVSEIAENLDNLRKPIKSIDRDKIKGKIPYYGAAGIVDYINDYLFDGTYLLFGEDGENLLSRKLPQAFIVKGKFWVNNHAHILRVYDEFDINLIVNILESKKYDDIVYGSAQPKINKSDLNRIKIIIPKDIDEQKRISKSITTIDIEISTKQNKIAVLERLKKSLMQNLLTGKVRVKL